MGSTLSSRILILGIDGSGKTTFLNKFQNPKQNIAAEPTASFNEHDVKFGGLKFNVWDVSGAKSVRSLWPNYYKEGSVDAIIWVIDSADKDRFDESRKELEAQLRHPVLAGKTLCILCNKQDEQGAMSPDEILKKCKLEGQTDKRTIICKGISAKTGAGIKEVMKELAKELKVELKSPR